MTTSPRRLRSLMADTSYRAESGCPRGCPEGECYCSEPTIAERLGMCIGCGGIGECYCGEE